MHRGHTFIYTLFLIIQKFGFLLYMYSKYTNKEKCAYIRSIAVQYIMHAHNSYFNLYARHNIYEYNYVYLYIIAYIIVHNEKCRSRHSSYISLYAAFVFNPYAKLKALGCYMLTARVFTFAYYVDD